MSGIKGKVDRQRFNSELVAMATAVNNKGSRKVEIRSFSTGVIFALLAWSEREKDGIERKREPCQAHCSAGIENFNRKSLHKL